MASDDGVARLLNLSEDKMRVVLLALAARPNTKERMNEVLDAIGVPSSSIEPAAEAETPAATNQQGQKRKANEDAVKTEAGQQKGQGGGKRKSKRAKANSQVPLEQAPAQQAPKANVPQQQRGKQKQKQKQRSVTEGAAAQSVKAENGELARAEGGATNHPPEA